MANKILRSIAVATYRRPEGHRSASNGQRHESKIKIALYVAAIMACAGAYIWLSTPDIKRWGNFSPSLPVYPLDWRAFSPKEAKVSLADCPHAEVVTANCAANPDNPSLWQSSMTRHDDKGKLRRWTKNEFWIGTTISAPRVEEALKLKANQFIVGWAHGGFDIWVNGVYYGAMAADDREPFILSLPLDVLARKQPIKIAMLLHPDSDGGSPDKLASPWHEGLATHEEAAAFRNITTFWKKTRPLSLFLIDAFFSVGFFLLWTVQRRKQEYFYISLYTVITAMIQLRSMDIFRASFGNEATRNIDTFFFFFEAGFGLLLALSFARAPRSWFAWGLPALFIIPGAIGLVLNGSASQSEVNHFLSTWVVPLALAAGSIVCAIQAFYLYSDAQTSASARARMRRLVLFSCGMLAMAAVYSMQNQAIVIMTGRAILSRFSHMGIVVLLAVIAIIEYYEDRKLLDRAPLSRYHRQRELPAKVKGVILRVDLKKSERLFRAETGQAGMVVPTCLSQMWSAIAHYKGTVIETEGDGLMAVFDEKDCADPLEAALKAVDKVKARLNALHEQFLQQGVIEDPEIKIEFRAGVAAGEIQPIWRNVDGSQIAAWIEAGGTNPFVDSARMMEVERTLPEAATDSIVAIAVQIGRETQKLLNGEWLFFDRDIEGKHARVYTVSAYMPSGEDKNVVPIKRVA